MFSFNSAEGACPACRGLGVEDRIDPDLLVTDPARTLRQGALALTTPNGYIIYSQVTMEVLDEVCRAHGFSVDIPWRDLTDAQRAVVLDGSDRILIRYGKHPLESRLRWKGIVAKPREEGYYKGILPVMETILRTKRNDNILRFARTLPCRACGGRRLRPESLRVTVAGRSIADIGAMTIRGLAGEFRRMEFDPAGRGAGEVVRASLLEKTDLLERLGLGYLRLDRAADTLSGGEIQRIRLAAQARNGLRGVLYVLDEPTAGLHPADTARLLDLLGELRDNGNTILVVEHDEEVMRAADHLIDLGPGPGEAGGRVLYQGPAAGIAALPRGASLTRDFLTGDRKPAAVSQRRAGTGRLFVRGARKHNLRAIDVEFRLGALNVVTGVSGAGKSTLVRHVLAERLRSGRLGPGPDAEGITVEGTVGRVVVVDQSPIGRTPRSNPATYTKISDRIRDIFAALPGVEGERLRQGPLLVQCRRRPVRDVPGRRAPSDRHALPGRRRRRLPRLRGPPLQRRDAGRAGSGPVDPRRPRDERRGGRPFLRRSAPGSRRTSRSSNGSGSATSSSARARRPCRAARPSGSSWPRR